MHWLLCQPRVLQMCYKCVVNQTVLEKRHVPPAAAVDQATEGIGEIRLEVEMGHLWGG